MKKFLFVLLIVAFKSFAEHPIREEHHKLVNQLIAIVNKRDLAGYKSLIHPKCPVDEEKIKSVLSNQWTNQYKIIMKSPQETFDFRKVTFLVPPDEVLELHMTYNITDPKILKMMKGQKQMELIKIFPLARFKNKIKILEWPCVADKK